MAPADRADIIPEVVQQLSFDALRILLLGAATLALIYALVRRRVAAVPAVAGLALLVALDLWSVERRYINWLPQEQVTFAPDEVVRTLRQDSSVFRVLNLPVPGSSYGHNYLATQRIRQVLGYQGTELHRYDELMGGKNVWANAGNPAVLRLVTAKYLVLPQQLPANPMLTPVGDRALASYDRGQAYLYRVNGGDPYAYVVPTAVKIADAQALAVISDPRSGFDPRKAILVPTDSKFGVDPQAVRTLAPPDSTRVQVERTADDVIRLALATPPQGNSYLFVSENYYPEWRATIDGKPAPVLRAQYSLIAVPLSAGARSVELRVVSTPYTTFRWVTFAALALVLATIASSFVSRRSAAHGA
jgi:hypothetical protein